ncbi:MAG: bifunctional metallophosphatase/5'-nucleotidase [Candidatus Eremiobacteraeota bacterium]|nr:bifunctional metallophosphatase/5'-nucleotidase [Candidatus Eremiobacteraeota bacterium]
MLRKVLFLLGLGLTVPALAEPTHITLLHLNDVYEYASVDDGRKGSFARLETLRRQAVAANPNTLFLFSGDTLSPSVASSFFRGRQMVEMWNAIHLDVATLGNHEFDFGPDVLRERMGESHFPWLAANVRDRSGASFGKMPEFVMREVGGVKLGIFGLLTVDTAETSSCGPEVVFQDPVEAARSLVPRMRAQGAQVVVALTHLSLAEDKRLAREVPLDLILGGHEHEPSESLVAHTPIFKWGSDARILGKVDLQVDQGRVVEMDWQGQSVGKTVVPDPTVTALAARYEKQLAAQLNEPLVRVGVDLEGRSSVCRQQETNLGNLVADAMREQAGADCALITGSSIRVDKVVPAGVLTRRQAMMILPYENGVVKVRLSGRELLAVVEHSVSSLGPENSSFPQVSALQLRYDPTRPVGQRVQELRVGGKPLQPDGSYTFACSEFIRKGGCGYEMLPKARLLVEPHDAPAEGVALIEYLHRHKVVSPRLEGRIQAVTGR